ncbi:MAG: RluA family pseudouridine synthase [Bacilli bacterium]
MNKEYIVQSDTKLLEFLFNNIENKSKNNIKSLLFRGNIFINNKNTTQFDYILKKGDIITIKTTKTSSNQLDALEILYEDKDLIAINKKPKLLTIATEKENQNTAFRKVSDYLKIKNINNRIFIVHRLDNDTSGVLLFAKNEKVKQILQNNWDTLVLKRNYIAVVEGNLKKEKGTVRSWLKENKGFMVYSSNKFNDGDEAITNYQLIKKNDKFSLVDINILTGRKNQIRVHMKDIGNIIVGDKKYGSTIDPIRRLCLHANILEFNHPITNKIIKIESKIPTNMKKLV